MYSKSGRSRLHHTVLLVLMVPLWLGSCKDKDDVEAGSVEGTWKITAFKSDPGIDYFGIKITDILSAVQLGTTCASDARMTFKADASIAVDAPAQCQTIEQQLNDRTGISDASKWKAENSKIKLTTATGTVEYDLTVNATTMQWKTKQNITDGNGKVGTYDLTLEFSRQ